MSDTTNQDTPAKTASDALKIVEDTVSIARDAEEQKEAAEQRAQAAEEQLVELQKVASAHEQAVEEIVDFLGSEGYLEQENQEKFASEMKADPDMAVSLIKRIVTFSASPYDEGESIPKTASSEDIDSSDPDAALKAAEAAAWEKMAEEGA